MPKVKPLMPGFIGFNCPGCGNVHTINIAMNGWRWNGDTECPTIEPSILHRSGHHITEAHDGECWCNFKTRYGYEPSFHCVRCHSYVRDGNIEFLPDCSHELAGQTVPLSEYTGVRL